MGGAGGGTVFSVWRRRGGLRAWSRLHHNSPPLPPVNLRFSFASARFWSWPKKPSPPPLGRSTVPSLSGSGRQNLDSTSSKMMKVKVESEKVGLKLNIQKTKII